VRSEIDRWLAPGKKALIGVIHLGALPGAPLVPLDPVLAAREMAERGGADGVIATGSATGAPADRELVRRLAEDCPGVDLLVGSGSTPENVPLYLPFVRGFLVATWCEAGGQIDRGRVSAIADAIHRRYPR
jgi:predicted TIM-barrel enzyme